MKPLLKSLLLSLGCLLLLPGCQQLNDERIPTYAVSIDLGNPGIWSAYGVVNYGQYNYFVLPMRLPQGFPYNMYSATGYGGVLLIMGFDPALGEPAPLVYDMSCPVERLPDVRVYVDPESPTFEAVCEECGSHYDVANAFGAPTSGPALSMKYALTPYRVLPSNGGYIIGR